MGCYSHSAWKSFNKTIPNKTNKQMKSLGRGNMPSNSGSPCNIKLGKFFCHSRVIFTAHSIKDSHSSWSQEAYGSMNDLDKWALPPPLPAWFLPLGLCSVIPYLECLFQKKFLIGQIKARSNSIPEVSQASPVHTSSFLLTVMTTNISFKEKHEPLGTGILIYSSHGTWHITET